jgi:hypothetical protein
MNDQPAPRLSVVARNSAVFMRSAARAASLPALEVMQVSEASESAEILSLATIAVALAWRRAPSQTLAEMLRRLLLSAASLHLALDMTLMPQVISLDPLIPRYRSLDSLSGAWCYRNCRFRLPDMPRVLHVLRLPAVCHLDNRASVPAETVLICSLYTLSWPRTQDETAAQFGFANQSLVSRIYIFFCVHVVRNFGHLVQQADDDDDGFLIWAPYMAFFQDCIYAISTADDMRDVAMFTDGTFRPSCRPAQRQEDAERRLSTQRRVYSGALLK